MSELKPCPFCGSHVSLTYNSVSNTFNFWHKQDTTCCFVEPMQVDGTFAKSLYEATEIWNRRPHYNTEEERV